MTYAGVAAWLRPRLWIGKLIGAGFWLFWFGSLAIGWANAGRPVDAEGMPIGVDHLTFYSAARLIREGRPAAMYDYDFLSTYQGEVLGWDWGMLLAYRNPPFYALLYLPTAGLPFVASLLVWSAIGLVVLALAAFWLAPERPLQASTWSLAFYPVFATVQFGQNTLLSLGIFAAVYRLLTSGRPFAAGLAAGLLWFKPQLLIGLFLWWGFAPRLYSRCWAGVAVMGAILAAISWLALPDASQAFVNSLAANIGYTGEKEWNKQSPRAFWSLLLPGAESWLVWALTAATALVAIAAAWRLSRRSGARVAEMFPIAVFLTLWVSPHALIYEWALLVPAALVLWNRFPERHSAWLCLFSVAWGALAVSTLLAKLQIDSGHTGPVVQLAIPVMGVVAWLVVKQLDTGNADKSCPAVATQ